MQKELKVSAIKNGTAIDHIPSDALFKVIQILGLDKSKHQITFGMNLESKRMGNKAIIKIADRYFEDDEINRITLVAPHAKLNIIKDYEVIEKRVVEVPDFIEGIAKCINPKCVSNVENIKSKFKVIAKDKVTLQCHYCERVTNQENIIIKN
jgi:aspartate carbamoyltransferase regulatory subunit